MDFVLFLCFIRITAKSVINYMCCADFCKREIDVHICRCTFIPNSTYIFTTFTRRPSFLAVSIMFFVPRDLPSQNAINVPAMRAIFSFRRGPAERPYLFHSAGTTISGSLCSIANRMPRASAPVAPPEMISIYIFPMNLPMRFITSFSTIE